MVLNRSGSERSGAGLRVRKAVAGALDRFGRRSVVGISPPVAPVLSQSSRPSGDLSALWSQESDRLAIYRDADLMDAESDLTSAALNAWATTATAGSLFLPQNGKSGMGVSAAGSTLMQAGGGLLRVECRGPGREGPVHSAAQVVADQVFRDCRLGELAWTIARDTRKYGDCFLEVVVDEDLRVRRLKPLPAAEMVRDEDEFGRLRPVAFRQQRLGVPLAEFAAWQVVHLRCNFQGSERYGRSGLRTARRIWRMLSLLEDSLVSGRLTRAYQKLVHFLPVTDGTTQQERQQMVQEYMRAMTRTPMIDPETGRMDLRLNPASVTTDYYLTVSPSDSPKTGIQSLDPANAQISHIADMEYFQNLLVAGLEVPKAYLGLERDVNSRATLGYQEIHFLRQAGSLQNTLMAGYRSVLDLGFTLAGINPSDVEVEFLWGG